VASSAMPDVRRSAADGTPEPRLFHATPSPIPTLLPFASWSLAQLDRKARDGKSSIPESMFVFTNRDGQPYTEQGFKVLWSKIMADWVGRDENPETHANPATTRRIYDRRRVVKIKSSA